MIEAAGLSVSRGVRPVLEGLAFRCEPGEFVTILGLNGAGKSTLLETLAGILTGYRGQCRLQGRELSRWSRLALSRAVSFLPQTSATQSGFAVRQVVAMGRYPHTGGWTESPDDRAAIAEAMQQCECDALADRPFGTLSGGERQRALLAAALCQRTPVLLLDEPSAHVDLPVQAKLFELLRRQADQGTLCIAALHDVGLAAAFSTRILLLHGKGVVYDGAANALLDHPAFGQVFGPGIGVLRGADGASGITYQTRQHG